MVYRAERCERPHRWRGALVPMVLMAVAVGAAVTLWSAPARACSCSIGPGRFVGQASGTLPSNARGMVWWGGGVRWVAECQAPCDWAQIDKSRRLPAAEAFGVEHIAGGHAAVLPHSIEPILAPEVVEKGVRYADAVLVVPTERLKARQKYRFNGPDESSVTVEISNEALLPTTVSLKVGDEERGPLKVEGGPACTQTVDAAQRQIELELSGGASRWADALMFTTLVDGQPWRPKHSVCQFVPHGASWTGKGDDRLYSVCAPDSSASTGMTPFRHHEVQMTGVLPGTSIAITSHRQAVTLSCWREGKPSGSASAGSPAEGQAPAGSDSSCSGCATAPRGEPWLVAMALGALALAVAARRRGRSRQLPRG